MDKTCALTGHRALSADFSAERLREQLLRLIGKGTDTFLCGMARGFDFAAAEVLLALKREYPLRLVACVPCADQAKGFSAENKKKYENLLNACDETVILHESYLNGCMFERNRYMVDRADFVFAYLARKKGGTAYTVNYAKRKGKPVLFYGEPEQLTFFGEIKEK